MRPTLWLRIAAVLAGLNATGHTIGLFSKPQDPEAQAAVAAMQAHSFNAMGSVRNFWDFYSGFSLIITVTLLLVAALCWQLGSMVQTQSKLARPLIASLCIATIAFVLLSWTYLFVVPTINIAAIAISLAIAWRAA